MLFTCIHVPESDAEKDIYKLGQNKNDVVGAEKENAIIPYGKKDMKCFIDAYICDESKEMDRGSRARYELFSECYTNVDAVGFLIREKEKEKNIDKSENRQKGKEKDIDKEKGKERGRDRMSGDDNTICYGEVEYVSFQEVSLSVLP